jgi:hypothetical protein
MRPLPLLTSCALLAVAGDAAARPHRGHGAATEATRASRPSEVRTAPTTAAPGRLVTVAAFDGVASSCPAPRIEAAPPGLAGDWRIFGWWAARSAAEHRAANASQRDARHGSSPPAQAQGERPL